MGEAGRGVAGFVGILFFFVLSVFIIFSFFLFWRGLGLVVVYG